MLQLLLFEACLHNYLTGNRASRQAAERRHLSSIYTAPAPRVNVSVMHGALDEHCTPSPDAVRKSFLQARERPRVFACSRDDALCHARAAA